MTAPQMTTPRRLFTAGLLVLVLAVPAAAQFSGPGQATVTTVEQAHNARDETPFDLSGNLIERLGDDYYTFQDETGTITAEIEPIRFRGVTVTPETRIRITGEVDRTLRGRELEVRRIQVVE